jgi:hypothetical protein
MARPPKIDDWLVHRIAELFNYADEISELGEFPKTPDGKAVLLVWLPSPTSLDAKPLPIKNEKVIPNAIGYLLSQIKPEKRPYVLRRLADVLKGKRRKSADDLAKIIEACRRAKAKWGEDTTFAKVEEEYRKVTGFHRLDRRALDGLRDCPWVRSKRKKKLPRLLRSRRRAQYDYGD